LSIIVGSQAIITYHNLDFFSSLAAQAVPVFPFLTYAVRGILHRAFICMLDQAYKKRRYAAYYVKTSAMPRPAISKYYHRLFLSFAVAIYWKIGYSNPITMIWKKW
jgi:hypothetical protein